MHCWLVRHMRWGVSMRAAYETLGCKVNRYETDAMQEILEQAGFETVDFAQPAEIYVINTCTVTAVADKKSRQMISRAHMKNPAARIFVCGCMAQRDGERILAHEGVAAVIGSKNKSKILQIIERSLAGEEKIDAVEEILHEREFEPLQISRSTERTRASLKICDGCNNFCSYCIIPYTRGPVRSRQIPEIVQEAERLVAGGVQEIVLTGIHLGSYGKDLEEGALIDVIEGLNALPGLARIRLGSLEPSLLTEEFCRRAAECRALCPHFHVSLQSGSRGVLARMNRKYTPEQYAEHIANVRKYFKNPAITTDIIAGFQGESEAEHTETLAFLRQIGFAKIHVFPYSKREGTMAAKMGGDVPGPDKKRRAAEVAKLAEQMQQEYLRGFLGQEEEVLLEEQDASGKMVGHTARYQRVAIEGGAENQMVRVLITGVTGDTLQGQMR